MVFGSGLANSASMSATVVVCNRFWSNIPFTSSESTMSSLVTAVDGFSDLSKDLISIFFPTLLIYKAIVYYFIF